MFGVQQSLLMQGFRYGLFCSNYKARTDSQRLLFSISLPCQEGSQATSSCADANNLSAIPSSGVSPAPFNSRVWSLSEDCCPHARMQKGDRDLHSNCSTWHQLQSSPSWVTPWPVCAPVQRFLSWFLPRHSLCPPTELIFPPFPSSCIFHFKNQEFITIQDPSSASAWFVKHDAHLSIDFISLHSISLN